MNMENQDTVQILVLFILNNLSVYDKIVPIKQAKKDRENERNRNEEIIKKKNM